MEQSVVSNVWERIRIVCMNHKEPCDMKMIKNTELIKTEFYACEHYMPDRAAGDDSPPCYNRVNLDDYKGIVFEFIDLISREGPLNDFTNHTFSYKKSRQKIKVKVLKYSPDKEIVLGLLNTTVLGDRR